LRWRKHGFLLDGTCELSNVKTKLGKLELNFYT